MESNIERSMFGFDKVISIGKALGFNTGKMMASVTPDEMKRIITDAKSRAAKQKGAWYEAVIDLKSYLYLIEMYDQSPEMQKKAYTALQVHLRMVDFPPYEKVINDPAFGLMTLESG